MGKPFKTDVTPAPTDIGRMPNGKFVRIVPPAPPQIVKQAHDDGRTMSSVIDEHRAPEHPTPKGNPKAGEEIPWPPAGPVNDGNQKPMKVG